MWNTLIRERQLLEHIIYSAISSHANVHNIMCTNQHGFRKKRSCETQLLETVNDLTGALDAGYEADILFLDFSKAFDIGCLIIAFYINCYIMESTAQFIIGLPIFYLIGVNRSY